MILNLNGNGFSHLAVRCTGIHRQAVKCLFIMKAVLSFEAVLNFLPYSIPYFHTTSIEGTASKIKIAFFVLQATVILFFFLKT